VPGVGLLDPALSSLSCLVVDFLADLVLQIPGIERLNLTKLSTICSNAKN
jgi:hypothetical protein